MTAQKGEVTLLLERWRTGDKEAESQIFELLLPDLRKIATRCFRGEAPGNSLQPTLLVNEAFLRLARAKNIDWQNRGHFLAMSARMMRRYLIKRGHLRHGVQFLPLEGPQALELGERSELELMVVVDDLLDELAKESQQRRAIVELKFFLGMSDAEAADSLELKLHVLQREWYRARKWLFERLSTESCRALSKTTNA
jgi:RNA polymerase sigma factor (TIGR02999 family)